MYKRVLLCAFSFVVMVALLAVSTTPAIESGPQRALTQTTAANGFALIELYTSQGCSSCPPADALLGQLAMANDAQVLPIAFHVDYWNRLGWKDPFSSPIYSQRQRGYAAQFNRDGIYTPQAVVNGTRQMVGSDARLLAAAVAAAKSEKPAASIQINTVSQQADTIGIQYSISGIYSHATVHAVLVQEQVQTQIKAGENHGLSLTNYHIARDLKTAPATATGQIYLQKPVNDALGKCKVVLFVQQADGKIIGLTQAKL